jgi:hypothetical protein
MAKEGLALATDQKDRKKEEAIKKVVTKKLYGHQHRKNQRLQDDIMPNAVQTFFEGVEVFFSMCGRVLMIIPALVGGLLFGIESGIDAGFKKASAIYKRKEA